MSVLAGAKQTAVGPVPESIDRLAHVCTVRPRAQYTAAGEIHTMRNARCIRNRSETWLWLLLIRKPSAFMAF